MAMTSILPIVAMLQGSAQSGEPVPPPPPANWQELMGDEDLTPDQQSIDGRRRPGEGKTLPDRLTQDNPGALRAPPPEAFPTDQIPVPDRWRIMTSLCPKPEDAAATYHIFANLSHVCHSKADPYHQNIWKGDIPLPAGKRPGFLKEDDWFMTLSAISDTVLEPRTFPIPVGVQTTERPGSIDEIGRAHV